MNKNLTILLIFSLLVAGPAFGQVITPKNDRDDLVSGMNEVVDNTENEAGDFSDLPSPFRKKTDADMLADTTEDQVIIEEEVLPEIISDKTALEVISRRFKPDGSMIFGNRGILKLGNGETIEEGESFPAEIRGNTYTVEIVEVTARGYTLKIGEETVEKSFLKTVNQAGP
jgi:hypothetical protein